MNIRRKNAENERERNMIIIINDDYIFFFFASNFAIGLLLLIPLINTDYDERKKIKVDHL